jgi:hypothetical protein
MRRLLVPFLILATLFPAVALSSSTGPSDGTLAVRDARGKITLVLRGSLIGRFGNGTLKIEDLAANEGADPVVRGYEKVKWGRGNAPTYSGRNVRFRIIGGHYRVTFSAKAVYFSLVGKGRVLLDGSGSVEEGVFYDGFYSLNGAGEESLPDEPTWLLLAPPPPPPQSSD